MQVEQKFQCWVACTFSCLSLCVGNTRFFVKVAMYVCMYILHFHQIPIGDYRSLLGIMRSQHSPVHHILETSYDSVLQMKLNYVEPWEL
jgi:hypothetical protein